MNLSGKRAVVLAEDQYQDLELWYPLLRLRGAGIEVQVVGTGSAATYKGKHVTPSMWMPAQIKCRPKMSMPL